MTQTPPIDEYDDLFAEVALDRSVFAEKGALDPLAEPETVVARTEQERALARVLQGVNDGYLPTTVSIHGPPGTGKTLTTRRVCRAFARRTDDLGYAYVNLKECRSTFAAANEILGQLAGEKLGAYVGQDGVFDAIWTALEEKPEWTVLLLDEVDQVRYDRNYAPSDFFYRLLRGEGKLSRGLNLSVFLLSNQLVDVDLRLDSRVRGVMGDEAVFFPPYGDEELTEILGPRLERAFHPGCLPSYVRIHGIEAAARRFGDVRRAMTLFRRAGETADAHGLDHVAEFCIDENLDAADREATVEKILTLPQQHVLVLDAITGSIHEETDEIVQPVTTGSVHANYNATAMHSLSQRAIREVVADLEMAGLVDTWKESRGRAGRVKLVETTFEPAWVGAALDRF